MTTPDWRDFPPHVLREYALIADGERGALCGPRGDLAWLCAPGWADDAVFTTLVGGGGAYSASPVDTAVWGGYYEPGTLIWRNRWVTTDTVVECREALAFPGDPHRVVVLRRIEAVERDITLCVRLDPRDGFGRRSLREVRRADDGRWTARTGRLRMRWSGAGDAAVDESGRLVLTLTVAAGGRHDLVLELSDRPLPDPVDPDRAWHATETAWRSTTPHFPDSAAPRDARHAYAVLRGLTTSGGGMVAAATLGLPERAEAGRNYDYRYVWLRDQCYAGLAVSVDQPHPLLDEAVAFTAARLLDDGDRLAPAYHADGTLPPAESTLRVPGYPGGSAVVGNRVQGQFQLDVVGEILQLLAAAGRHDRLTGAARKAADVAVDVLATRWTEPDAGIWELHDTWWTQSRLACVAGLRAIAPFASPGRAGELSGLADAILAETSRRCLSDRGVWQRAPDLPGTDASLLLPPVRGALPAGDPRTQATLRAVHDTLVDDGYVYRFAPDDQPLGDAEGAFLLCGFVMSLASWQQGDQVTALRWLERNRAACGPPGLFAEEYDVRQRQLRGNLPQAFVHALFLDAAQRVVRPPA
ncbi:MAG TPA: glycoside hydrolase family 15 protein [Pseudonocardiaceae bacterium]|nr:glycoside hydrolase family 15 protein [Pseudonocardiaceae bacterium]